MKSITTFLILLSFTVYSQNNGKIEYKTFLSFGTNIEYNSSLFFDNENSLFSYKVKDKGIYESSENPFETNTIMIDTTTNVVYINKNKSLLFENHNKAEENYFSYEKIPQLKWEILSKTKIFNNITCLQAKTNFRGRVYYAWYAPTIPVSYGPWKLNGLPGLIIEAYDETKEVIFQFNKIKIPFQYDFTKINEEINKSTNISLSEYLKNRKNIDKVDLKNKIKTKFPRGISVKIEIKRTGIELNFNDILDDKN
ncbi:hypothetical protein Lupro_05550 [Lutibacter profundi]|uniref:GLPGLI family protein n=1 Tax=Lutibacter profundi TaxID=1622118 RepID=A0A0X8G605_9FLAO|nr:GLPGLI family protein [Lutibacter profundi]AMC10738.1 hypothetical protein Lupro_05550 [Lutibacter profundi]